MARHSCFSCGSWVQKVKSCCGGLGVKAAGQMNASWRLPLLGSHVEEVFAKNLTLAGAAQASWGVASSSRAKRLCSCLLSCKAMAKGGLKGRAGETDRQMGGAEVPQS